MKTKNILRTTISVVFIAFVFFAGCSSETYHYLQDEDITWMVYSTNQSLTFKNQAGDIRKYSVYNVFRGYTTDQGSNDEHIRAAIDLTSAANPNLKNAQLEIIKRAAGLDVIVSWPHFDNARFISNVVPVNDTINNKIYTDIYIMDNPLPDTLDNNVERIKYSRSQGHVQFIETNGDVWSRTN